MRGMCPVHIELLLAQVHRLCNAVRPAGSQEVLQRAALDALQRCPERVASVGRPELAACLLPLLSVRFFFHCFLTSPSGQRWHRWHASPFWQPCFLQNHAQGWQSPVPCMSEPAEAAEDRMVALSTRGVKPKWLRMMMMVVMMMKMGAPG